MLFAQVSILQKVSSFTALLHTYTHTHIHLHTHLHTHTHTYIHLHTHTHIHLHTHLHTHTDSIDTRTALESVREIISHTNIYIQNNRNASKPCNKELLKSVALYITDLLKVIIIIIIIIINIIIVCQILLVAILPNLPY